MISAVASSLYDRRSMADDDDARLDGSIVGAFADKAKGGSF
jgi:hypothetical protein